MKIESFTDDFVLQYFGDASVEGLKRYYPKEGYIACLPGVMELDDSIDTIEHDADDDRVCFTSKSGQKFYVELWEEFEIVVFIVQERVRFRGA